MAEPAEAVGHHGDAVVAPGTGDNMAAALALGLGPGDVAVSIGTSGVVSMVTTGPTADGTGLMINSSRAILYASSGAGYAEAAADAARELRDTINRCR